MSFAWPWALLALAAAPVLLAVLWARRRRRRRCRAGVQRGGGPRRGPAARPLEAARSRWPCSSPPRRARRRRRSADGPRTVARSATSVLLAIDVSRSMCSTDVAPNRLVVAQDAARTFIRNQDDGTRIGIVAFAGFAGLVVPPTTDTDRLIDAIDKLTTSRGTAIGMAILASIDAIAEYNSAVAPTGVDLGRASRRRPRRGRRRPRRRRRRATSSRTRSSCSPTAPTPRASSRSSPPSRRRPGTSGCTPSASARPSRRSRCATSTSSAATCRRRAVRPRAAARHRRPGRAALPGDRRGDPAGRRRPDRRAVLPGRGRRPARRRLPAAAERGRATAGRRGAHRLVRARRRVLAAGAIGLSLWWNRYP